MFETIKSIFDVKILRNIETYEGSKTMKIGLISLKGHKSNLIINDEDGELRLKIEKDG